MMHNAACIAAMAFSNASVGVNHALAHAFGARFGVAHGRANALMLPHVIAYNASVPDQVHAVAESAGICRAQEIRHDRRPAGLGRRHDRRKSETTGYRATEQLLDQLAIPRSIAELGISREEFERPCPTWPRLLLTILPGARIRACRW